MDEKELEEIKRHFDVVAEDLKKEISIVAEGHSTILQEIKESRKENEEAHHEMISMVKFSYAELDKRITTLEQEMTSMKNRLAQVER